MVISRTRFNPAAQSKVLRGQGVRTLTADDLPRFGPTGVWRAGSEQLNSVLTAWWLGEVAGAERALAQARDWLAAPAAQGRPWGQPWQLHEAEHAFARALGEEMGGQGQIALWRAAHEAAARAVAELDDVGAALVSAKYALSAALCGEVPRVIDPDELTETRAVILACLAAPERAAEVIYANAPSLFAVLPDADVTAFMLWHWRGAAGVARPMAMCTGYLFAPELSLPIALDVRGWDDATTAQLRVQPEDFARLEQILPRLALLRDRGNAGVGAPMDLASWTRAGDLSLEADWSHKDAQGATLNLRGMGAARVASWLQEVLGRPRSPDPEDALAEMLTVPPRAVPADSGAAEQRWGQLCLALRDPPGAARMPARAMVRAALHDSDWRARMVAVWAVGRYRLEGLAAETEGASVPKADAAGLRQADRRVFLALRALSACRSAGVAFPSKSADRAFLARIERALDVALEELGFDGEDLVFRVLLRLDTQDAEVPRVWQSWRRVPANVDTKRPRRI